MYKKSRFQRLRHHFEVELSAYGKTLSKSRFKKDHTLRLQLKYFKWDYIESLMAHYLYRCKERHWLCFLQFRATLPNCDIYELRKLFRKRMAWLENFDQRVDQIRFNVQNANSDVPRAPHAPLEKDICEDVESITSKKRGNS